MTTARATGLTIAIEAELHERLCAIARRKGISIDEYCERAIMQAISSDAQVLMTVEERLAVLDRLDASRREIFGDQVTTRDAAEDIREARAIRDDQIDRAVRGE